MLNTFSIKPPSISTINSLFLYIFVGITGAVFLLSFVPLVPLSLQSLGIQNKQVPICMGNELSGYCVVIVRLLCGNSAVIVRCALLFSTTFPVFTVP